MGVFRVVLEYGNIEFYSDVVEKVEQAEMIIDTVQFFEEETVGMGIEEWTQTDGWQII